MQGRASKGIKGIFFTTEALLSLLLALLIVAMLPMQEPNTVLIYDYYTLSDTFSVVEKGYKPQLEVFLDTGADAGLGDVIDFISEHSGRRIFLKSGNYKIGPNCTPRNAIERIVITWLPSSKDLFVKKLTIGVCE